MKVYLTTARFPDLSNIQVESTEVELVAPDGYRWRYTSTGQIEVYRYGLRERIDKLLDVNLFHVLGAAMLVVGLTMTLSACYQTDGARNMKLLVNSIEAERNAR